MSERRRVGALIIENKKLLLVNSADRSYYYTPGGKIESGESDLEALKRELQEELSIDLVNAKPYLNYESQYSGNSDNEQINKVYCFLVDYRGAISPQNEVEKIFWYSKDDFQKGYPEISQGMKNHLVPKLIEDKLL